MEKYEREQWHAELSTLVEKGQRTWEGIVGNVGVFCLTHGRPDIAKLLFEFVCLQGDFTLVAFFNLSTHYLALAKSCTASGATAPCFPMSDATQWSEGSMHPDALVNTLLKRKEALDAVA